jgi:hypothetical protein
VLDVACECILSCVRNSFLLLKLVKSFDWTDVLCVEVFSTCSHLALPPRSTEDEVEGGTASVAVNKVNGYASDVTSVNSSTLLVCFQHAFTCGTTASQHGGEALPAWHLGEQDELTRPRYNERCSTLPLPLRSTPRLTCASLARTFFLCRARSFVKTQRRVSVG